MSEFEDTLVVLLPRLRRFARMLTRDAASADDLLGTALERALRKGRIGRFVLPHWAALAATLVTGIVAGHLLTPRIARPLDADTSLSRSLDGSPVTAIRIGFSYRDRSKTFCRVFRDDRAGPTSGVACRDDDGWHLRVVAAAPPRPLADYRTAAADLPPAVTATVDATIVGMPLDASGEASAEKRDWKK